MFGILHNYSAYRSSAVSKDKATRSSAKSRSSKSVKGVHWLPLRMSDVVLRMIQSRVTRNRRGERMQPCRTPDSIGNHSKSVLLLMITLYSKWLYSRLVGVQLGYVHSMLLLKIGFRPELTVHHIIHLLPRALIRDSPSANCLAQVRWSGVCLGFCCCCYFRNTVLCYAVLLLAPYLNPNLEDQVLTFVWPLL